MTARPQTTLDGAVVRRIVATGTLTLEGPALFGGGQTQDVDISLLRDAEGAPFIPGASIAGATRSHLAWRLSSDVGDFSAGIRTEQPDLRLLFGDEIVDETDGAEVEQGALTFDEVRFDPAAARAIRDSVRIDPRTGTALAEAKFDYEVLEPGAAAPLRIELAIRAGSNSSRNEEAVVHRFHQLLETLRDGEVRLGAMTRRGFGRVRVGDWQVDDYRVASDRSHALAWLAGRPSPDRRNGLPTSADEPLPPARSAVITVDLELNASVLVRAASANLSEQVDVRAFESGDRFVIPGRSWTGVLRARALRITRTLNLDEGIVESMFGPVTPEDGSPQPGGLYASRVAIDDTPLDGERVRRYRQTRVRIDRLTGGASDGGLFTEEPVWRTDRGATLALVVDVREPRRVDLALLLLVIRDLWEGDLSVGGEASVGRGTFQGLRGGLKSPFGVWGWHADGNPRPGSAWTFDTGTIDSLEEQLFGTHWPPNPNGARKAPTGESRADQD